jgi:NADH-quinone oxidoreductase subunit G
VPFYDGLTLEEIGGRGVRWPERESASTLDLGENFGIGEDISQTSGAPKSGSSRRGRGKRRNGPLRLGTYRPIWASPEVEISPSLQYTVAHQQAELSPEDAARLGIVTGETIEVAQNGTSLKARAAVRSGVPAGTVFLATGVAADSANALTEPEVEVHKP